MFVRSPFVVAALWCSAAVLPVSPTYAQQSAALERQAIVNRHRVRSMLAAAMADGKLQRKEQYEILLKASNLLSPPELQGLQRTLDEAASRQEARLRQAQATGQAEPKLSATLTGFIVPTAQEEAAEPGRSGPDSSRGQAPPNPTGQASNGNGPPAPPEAADKASPFHEEAEPIDRGYLVEELTKDVEPGKLAEPGEPDVQYDITMDELTGFASPESSLFEGWHRLEFTTGIDAFKGPLDLDNQNGNFGIRFGINGGFALHPSSGYGIQAGTTEVLSDFHGTRFTGATIRAQNFTTVGIFQRHPLIAPNLSWGFAFDWLHDRYYSSMDMTQWRIKFAYDWDCCQEFGLWATIGGRGHYATIGSPGVGLSTEHFKPISQGNFYYRRYWENGAKTSCWIGMAEKPTEVILGTDAQIPLTDRIALTGEVSYFLPTASGPSGQEEEMWNVSIGVVITPGRLGNHGRPEQFDAFFPVANNGTFGIRRF
jgi:hypothetical protein